MEMLFWFILITPSFFQKYLKFESTWGTLRKVISASYIFILMLLREILFTFIYEWKQTENHKEEVQKKECFVGMFMVPMPWRWTCPFILKNILNWENTDTVLYYSKRLVINSLLAEFNQCYTEGRIDEIRQMLVEKEK